jgi:hypothetical protein
MRVLLWLAVATCLMVVCRSSSPPLAMALHQLVSDPLSGQQQSLSKPPATDPEVMKRASMVPKMNLKESWNRHKTTVLPRLRRGSPIYLVRKFVFSSIGKSKDFLLDNAGNLIYKSLPFVIALLHLPIFKKFTEGTPILE